MPRKSKAVKKRVKKAGARKPAKRTAKKPVIEQQGAGYITEWMKDHPYLVAGLGSIGIGAIGLAAGKAATDYRRRPIERWIAHMDTWE